MVEKILQVKGTPLIKFQKAKRIQELREGTMHFCSLKTYRDKAKQSVAIGDDYEAVLHFNEAMLVIPQEDGSSIMEKIDNELLKTSHSYDLAFCMFGINSKNEHFQYTPEQREKMREFGNTALLITDADEFYKRISSALVKEGISLENSHCGFVKYYDETIDSVERIVELFKGMHNIAFQKRQKYAYQQEYRFLLPNSDESKTEFDLYIGDISGISEVISTDKALRSYLCKQTKEGKPHE